MLREDYDGSDGPPQRSGSRILASRLKSTLPPDTITPAGTSSDIGNPPAQERGHPGGPGGLHDHLGGFSQCAHRGGDFGVAHLHHIIHQRAYMIVGDFARHGWS